VQLVVAVTGTPSGAHVHLTPNGPGGVFTLDDGDALGMRLDGASTPLRLLDDGTFAADVPAHAGTFAFDFTRAGDRSAEELDVVLPAPIKLATPKGPVSRAVDLVLTWNGGDPGQVTVQIDGGACIVPRLWRPTQDGALLVPAHAIPTFVGHDQDACPMTITVTRQSVVQTPLVPNVDPGGWFYATATQSGAATLTSVP
jgi:hypothetical protein